MNTPPSSSEKKPRALVLSPEVPYPAHGGGAIRTASVIEYLAQRFQVHLIVFREAGAADPQIPSGTVEKLDVVELPRHSRHPAARAWRNAIPLVPNRPPLI